MALWRSSGFRSLIPPWSRASFASLVRDPQAQFLVATLDATDATAGQRLGRPTISFSSRVRRDVGCR